MSVSIEMDMEIDEDQVQIAAGAWSCHQTLAMAAAVPPRP
jgi:hypothetical protein